MKIAGVPSNPKDEPRRKLVKELAVFFLGMGTLMLVGGWFAFDKLDASSPPFMGMPRRFAVGIPLIALGVWHVAAGALLAVLKKPVIGAVGAVATTVFALTYFAFMALTVGLNPNGLNLLVLVMPVLAWHRAVSLMKLA